VDEIGINLTEAIRENYSNFLTNMLCDHTVLNVKDSEFTLLQNLISYLY